MEFTFDISGSQINGARDYQEDAFLITHLGDSDKPAEKASLVIVADGMGGHAAGNVASNMAVQTFNKYLTGNYPSDQMQTVLREAVFAANGSIEHTVKETEALKGMGCTFVGVIMLKTQMRWVSVGDSNLYLLRDKELIKKNADHSYGGFLDRMAAAGTPVKAEQGFSRNMLMSALTGEDIAEVDCPAEPFEVKAGDRIIVSSDGMDSLSDTKIIHYCEGAKTAKDCVKALLDGVEEAKIPRQDNTTIVVIDIIAKEEKPAVAPPPPPARTLTPDEEQDLAITKYAAPGAAPPIAIKLKAPPPPPPVEEEPKRNWLKIAAMIAGVLIVGAGVAYFVSGGKSTVHVVAKKHPAEAETAAGTPAPAAPETATTAEKAGTPTPPTTATPSPAPAATTATPATPAPPAPAGNIEEFQDALKSGGGGPAMVWVPAGKFEMGAPPTAREADQRPRHAVQIGKKFAMSKYEITVAEYEKFAKASSRTMPKLSSDFKPEHPVVMVSWEDALAYTHWLSEQTGFKYRLASEAEWEYAAAAGTDSYEWWWGREPGQGKAHCFGCGSDFDSRRPAKVGSFKPSPFGLYDTAGNVSEWVQDCYHNNYEGAPTDGSVWEGGDCNSRVVRGGSYDQPPKSIRASYRDKFNAAKANENIGIRVVREP